MLIYKILLLLLLNINMNILMIKHLVVKQSWIRYMLNMWAFTIVYQIPNNVQAIFHWHP
jgi:hypothetical protein